MRSILVIRLSSMGDVILATPLVRQLRATYPEATIDVAVAERFADVWAYNPRVNHVFAIANDAESQTASRPIGPYDLIVDLQANARSRSLRNATPHTTHVKVNKHRLEKLALVYLKRRPAVVTPITERYRRAVSSLALVEDREGPEVWLPGESPRQETGPHSARDERFSTREGPRVFAGKELYSRRIAVAPGAHHFTKRWPAEKFIELCKGLISEGAVPVLVGGAGDLDLCNAIADAVVAGGGDAVGGVAADGVRIENRAGAGTVQVTARVLDTCALIITNDTGVMHLASARRLPVVAIFGSTVGDLGFAPYGVPHTIVEHAIACRPCTHIGRAACPRGHFLCMQAISADSVLAAARDLICRVGIRLSTNVFP